MPTGAATNTLGVVPRSLNSGLLTCSVAHSSSSTPARNPDVPTFEEGESRRSIQIEPSRNLAKTTTSYYVPDEYFKPIKNWEGVVENVLDNSFVATMREADNPNDYGEEQFEIGLEDVELGDRDLVHPGAVFYFTVGYRIRRGGTRIKGTQIVFRRMPRWSPKDIERTNHRASWLYRIMMGEHTLEQGARD